MALTDKRSQLGWQLALFLAGALLSGTLMMIRGDWLGREAASEVEMRLNKRIDRYERTLDRRLERIEEKIDEALGKEQ